MPTRRAYFVFLFSLMLLLGAWLSKLIWIYFSFCVSFGLIIISYLFSRLLLFNINITRQHSPQAYEDDFIQIKLSIKSRVRFWDYSIEIEDTFSAGLPQHQKKVIFLTGLPQGKFEFSYRESCYKRGRYRLGPVRIKIFEPLGLFSYQKEVPFYSTLTVYPRIFPVERLPFILGHLALRFGEQTTRISGNYEEFYGIREYHQEDGWRRIHWPSTARLGKLIVRHFEQSSQWKAVLVLDANRANNIGFGKDTTFEYGVKIIASLAKYLMFKGASFGFSASTKKPLNITLHKGQGHFYRLLDELATIEADGNIFLSELIARYRYLIPPSSSLVIITNNFDRILINLLRGLKLQKNIGIVAVVLNAASFLSPDLEKKTRLRTSGMKSVLSGISSQVYFINCRDDLRVHFTR